jgi:hypothetical protein
MYNFSFLSGKENYQTATALFLMRYAEKYRWMRVCVQPSAFSGQLKTDKQAFGRGISFWTFSRTRGDLFSIAP